MKRKRTQKKGKHQLNPELWIRDYQEYLVNYARKKVSDQGVAEDLVQDTFLSVWSARERFHGACSEKTWLVGALRNKIIDHYRHSSRRPLLTESDLTAYAQDGSGSNDAWLDQHAVASDRFSPSKNTERFEFMQQLNEGIALLPDLSGKAFQMREIQGLSTDEITRSLNITKSNLWVLIHRAKTGLQDHFKGVWSLEDMRAAA
ncbi:MAG: sigma-70 family RNA polymerase sigma factor [Verrucomicrobia bacterium]|nr:sigma-70 family RNA polymerase sigma factor [Verrucomicrobiota bacterium]